MSADGHESGSGSESDVDTRAPVVNPSAPYAKSFDPKYARATREELNMLRYMDPSAPAASGNTLALELKVLVKSLRVKYAKLKPLERCLFDLRAMLLKLPAKAGVTSRALKLRGIKLFQQHSSEITLDFAPPAAVDVVGSFLLHTLSRPALNVDLAVTMPASCFSRKDTVNHRYHDKRSLYLGVIAKAVGRSKAFKSVYFEAMHRDTSKPVLVLVPTAAPKFKIRVHVAVAPGTFQSHRLAPTFSNVRPAVTGLVAARDSSEDDAAASSPATPHYNTSILQDVHKQLQLKTFHEALSACPAAAAAVVVMKSWLRCRNDVHLADSFTGFHLTALMVFLLQTRILADNMLPYQIVRSTFQWLAAHSLATTPIVLAPPASETRTGDPNAVAPDALAAFRAAFDVVMIGPSHELNLAAAMSAASAAELQRDARTAMRSMRAHRPMPEGSRRVFAHVCTPTQRYDRLFALPYPQRPVPRDAGAGAGVGGAPTQQLVATAVDVAALCDRPWARVVEDRIVAVVKQALTDRAAHVRVVRSGGVATPLAGGDSDVGGKTKKKNKKDSVARARAAGALVWNVNEAVPCETSGEVWLGVVLNADEANRIVDKGPPADHTKEATAFRSFWGDKSELRRFQDGSIIEAAVWEVPTKLRPTIVHSIVQYILQRHLRVNPSAVTWQAASLEAVLEPGVASYAEQTITALDAFKVLSNSLRDVPHMPLQVKNVEHASPELRYTAVRPIMPHPLCGAPDSVASGEAANTPTPLEVVVTFESSTLWPEDLAATRATKAAFYLKFAYGLKSKHKLKSIVSRHFVDVMVAGFVFRVRIFHARELVMLRFQANSHPSGFINVAPSSSARGGADSRARYAEVRKGMAADPAAKAQQAALLQEADTLQQALVFRPEHASTLHGLHMKHPSLAGAVRLALRWLSAHMFLNHVEHEIVELLVAYVYLDSRPYTAPNAPLPAFLRWLNLMATFDFEEQPLLVDLNESEIASDSAALFTKFKWLRKTRPGFCPIFIATPADRPMWQPRFGRHSPEPIVLARMRAFAAKTLALLEQVFCPSDRPSASRPLWSTAFQTPLGDFDALIKLNRKRLRHLADDGSHVIGEDVSPSVKSKWVVPLYRNMQASSRRSLMIGFDPLQTYLSELQANVGDLAMFFSDTQRTGGAVSAATIGIVWRRDVVGSSPTATLRAIGRWAADDGGAASDDDAGRASKRRRGQQKKANKKKHQQQGGGKAEPVATKSLAALNALGVMQALGSGFVSKVMVVQQPRTEVKAQVANGAGAGAGAGAGRARGATKSRKSKRGAR